MDVGSAIFIYAGTGKSGENTIISNCVISDNVTGGRIYSAAIYSEYGNPLITNCTIVNNAPVGMRAYDSSSSPVIKNTILWNNGDDLNGIPSGMISYSNIQDGDFKGQMVTFPKTLYFLKQVATILNQTLHVLMQA